MAKRLEAASATSSTASGQVQRSGPLGFLSGPWAAAAKLGPKVLNVLKAKGLAGMQVIAPVVAVATDPLGAMLSGVWLSLPGWVKPSLIDFVLKSAGRIVQHIEGSWTDVVSLGLVPVLRQFAMAFITRLRQVPEALKVEISDRLARFVSGGSAPFAMGLVEGMALALWDVLKGPIDTIKDVVNACRWIADFAKRMRYGELGEGLSILQSGLSAAWDELAHLVANPRQALQLLGLIMSEIERFAGQMGGLIAGQIVALFRMPDEVFGRELGKIATSVVIEIVKDRLTAGLIHLVEGVKLLGIGRDVRNVLKKAESIVKIIEQSASHFINGVLKLLVTHGRGKFRDWLKRLLDWLMKVLGIAKAVWDDAQEIKNKEGPAKQPEENSRPVSV